MTRFLFTPLLLMLTTACFAQKDSVKMQMYTSEYFGLHFKYMDGFSITDHSSDQLMNLEMRYKSVPNTFIIKTLPATGKSVEDAMKDLHDNYKQQRSTNPSLTKYRISDVITSSPGTYTFAEGYDYNGSTFLQSVMAKELHTPHSMGVVIVVEFRKADLDALSLIQFELVKGMQAFGHTN